MINKVKSTSFRFKLLFAIVMISLISTFIISAISYNKSKLALEEQAVNQLVASAAAMKNQLRESYDRSYIFTDKLGHDRLIEGLFIAYGGAYYGAANFPGGDQKIFSEQYKGVDKLYGERVRGLAKDFGFKDIFLVEMSGQVIMSASQDTKGDILGRNLSDGAFKDLLIGKCFKNSVDSKESKPIASGFEFNKILNRPTAFMCIKMFAEFDYDSEGIAKGDVMGIVITEVDFDSINELLGARVGMGQTGQRFLVGPDKLLRTNLFINKEKFNVENSWKNNIKVDTKQVQEALAGKDGSFESSDVEGRKVLSVFSPIKFFGETWAMVSEKQMKEILIPVNSMLTFIIIAVIALLVGILFVGFILTKALIKPIVNANEVLEEVSEKVGSNAIEMKDNSEELSQGATAIASAIQETVSTLDELSSMVNKNLDNVELSSQKSEESQKVAEQGKSAVTNMLSAMDDINVSNDNIVGEMNNISDRMQEIISVINEIGEKTKVINDIVFQTKLLSFNASVEAARAGEHGKGFAVVAEEVGTLATASGSAATEISSMLEESTRKVQDIVSGTKEKLESLAKNGREKVDNGTAQAKECEEALTSILNNVIEVNEKVREINYASNEQATGITEVAKAMGQLDELTHSTTVISTTALKNSEALDVESQRLQDIIEGLADLVHGGGKAHTHHVDHVKNEAVKEEKTHESSASVLPFEKSESQELVEATDVSTENIAEIKSVVGESGVIPDRDDDRFEDI